MRHTSSWSVRPSRGRVRLLVAIAAVAAPCARVDVGGRARAQPVEPPALVLGDEQGAGGHDVYLNDSFEAADAFTKAESLKDRERWNEAAETLQLAADRFGDHLVRLGDDHYIGVRRHVHNRICAWPHAGITAYQRTFDEEASEALGALSAPGSLEDYALLFERYFPTRVMAERAREIAERALEAGDLALARHVLTRVQEKHPDADRFDEAHTSMLAVLDAMEGRLVDAGALPPSLQDARIRWMGQERPLGDVIGEVAAGFEQLRAPADPSEWPIFGGDAGRNRPSRTSVDELGLLWRHEITATPDKADIVRHGPDDDEDARVPARELTMQPVVADGLIYVQKLRSIIALHETTGGQAWRFDAEESANEDTLYVEDRPPGWDAVTVYGGRVYASLPGDTIPYYSYDSSRTPHELVCLDAGDGSVIWRTNQHLTDDRFAEIHFDSSPLVYRDRVYVVGRRSRSFGFEDCYLYRLDADNGNLIGRTHLGSASTGGFGTRPATRTAPAMRGDTIYVCSNLGSIAAVAAHTGSVRWLRLYDRNPPGGSDDSDRYGSDARPWQFNPVMHVDGRIVVVPNSGNSVLVSDAAGGAPLQQIPREQIGGLHTALGIHDNLLCGAGRAVACYDLKAGEPRWTAPLPEEARLLGRGAWAGDRLIVPTRKALSFYSVAGGTRSDIDWNIEAEGGNLLALPDRLVVAGAHTVSVYVRKTEIWQSLRDRMAAAPDDPVPALELAELAVRSGEKTDGLAALREADRRATQGDTMPETQVSARLFSDALSFAESLMRADNLTSDELDALFAMAARYPVDAEEHLAYRVRFADLYVRDERPERAMELYHQILRDRSLRDLPAKRRRTGRTKASNMAQANIAALIQAHGQDLYEPFEARARALVESGTAAGDEATLRRVVDIYPNSRAAAEALIAVGKLAAEEEQWLDAARLWSRAYQRYPKREDRPELMRRIADAYEQAGRLDHAYRWLTKAAREYPQARTELNGKMVLLAIYRDRLSEARSLVEPERPRLSLPLDHQFERTFGSPVRLLEPRFADDPRQRWSAAFVYVDGAIRALEPATSADLWDEPFDVRSRPELLLATHETVLFATAYEVFALDARRGRRLWKFGGYPPDFDQQDADWEDGRILRLHALHGTRLVSVRDDGEVSCLDISSGRTLWKRSYEVTPGATLAVFDDDVVYAALREGRARVHFVDGATGAPRTVVETEIDELPERLVLTIDGQLIVLTPRTLAAFDLETHQRRWLVRLRGQLRPSSVLVDLDAAYFCQDGRRLQKIGLDAGQVVWETDELTTRPDSEPVTRREGGYLIVTTARSVSAIDPIDGMTLWQGVHAEKPNFVATLLTASYVVAVDRSENVPDGKTVAYFYDHRNASGVIPPGGAPNLGAMEDVRTVAVYDRSLLIQMGSSILGITDVAQGAQEE